LKNANSDRQSTKLETKHLVTGDPAGPATRRKSAHFLLDSDACFIDAKLRFIARQKQHHRKICFRDEFIQFLIANEIDFDERYV